MKALMKNGPDLSLRTFLVGSAGSALVMAFGGVVPAGCSRTALEQRQFSPTIWFEMNAKGKTVINITKAEMGQHVGTAIFQAVEVRIRDLPIRAENNIATLAARVKSLVETR